MLLSLLASTLVQCLVKVSAFPRQTPISNSTQLSSSGGAATGCSNQCFRYGQPVASISWSQMEVTATVTLETLLLVVNNRSNSTRTSTISNTAIDLKDYVPATTNSAGTATTSVILQDGSTLSTRFIAYPTTAFEDYPSTYSLCGTVETTIGSSATCLTYQTGCDVTDGFTAINDLAPTFSYPSHPPLPEGVDPGLDLVMDPKGWTYSAVLADGDCGDSPASVLFPDLGLWACTEVQVCAAFIGGPQAKKTALVLTATSTLTESGVHGPPVAEISGPNSVAATTTATERVPNLFLPPLPIPATLLSADDAEATPFPEHGPGLTKGQGEVALPPGLPPLPESHEYIYMVPVPTSYIDSLGNTILSTNFAEVLPVALSSTDARGKMIISTGFSTAAAPSFLGATAPPALIIGSQTITADSQTNFMIGSKTLPPGGSIAVSGIVISLLPDGSEAVVGTSTVTLISRLPSTTTPPSALIVDGQTITANLANQYVIDSLTLTPGGAITILGTRVSLSPDETVLVIGTSTETLHMTARPALVVGSQTITADLIGQYIFGDQTLTPGGAIFISGNTASVAPAGTEAAVGTSTESLGPYIIGGFGAGLGTGNASARLTFTGAATLGQKRIRSVEILGLIFLEIMIWL